MTKAECFDGMHMLACKASGVKRCGDDCGWCETKRKKRPAHRIARMRSAIAACSFGALCVFALVSSIVASIPLDKAARNIPYTTEIVRTWNGTSVQVTFYADTNAEAERLHQELIWWKYRQKLSQ